MIGDKLTGGSGMTFFYAGEMKMMTIYEDIAGNLPNLSHGLEFGIGCKTKNAEVE